MPKVRPGWTGKYKLGKHEFYMAYHYALQYNDWLIKYNMLACTAQGIRYDKDRVQTSPSADGMENVAIRRTELRERMELIEKTVMETDASLYPWLFKAVTNDGVTFNSLKNPSSSDVKPIPCERDMYYDRRRKFYWLLSQKIS